MSGLLRGRVPSLIAWLIALICLSVAIFAESGNGFIRLAAVMGGVGCLIVAWQFDEEARRIARELAGARLREETLEQRLEAQQMEVDALADGLDVALFICNTKTTILYANAAALNWFRFELSQAKQLLSVTLSHELERVALDALRTGDRQRAELTFQYPEERIGVVRVWLDPVLTGRVFVTISDLTDLRRLERVRQDFVANVSHEMRTPLTIIRSMAETIHYDDAQPIPKRKSYLEKIMEEVDRLTLIVNDLLILSAAESNPVRRQECDLAEIFKSTIARLEPKAQEKKLTLLYNGLDHLNVAANPNQVTQIAINLIDNALNYTLEGTVTVSVRQEGETAIAQVTDTGIGISSEHLPRVFERFYRIDKARSRATGGTGLGLAIVKHIAEVHGGTVDVQSALNVGSTFTVTLPLRDPTSN